MKNKKEYTSPTITAVDLDSKQAIVQVCMTGGIYGETGGLGWYCILPGDAFLACGKTPKLGEVSLTAGDIDNDEAPS